MQLSSHRRLNRLTGEYVLVSPQRTDRPWQGQNEAPEHVLLPEYDADCYLCPGNTRAGNQQNPSYSGPWAFDNDFPALSPYSSHDSSTSPSQRQSLLHAEPERGHCRVVCYSEKHNQTLATLSPVELVTAMNGLFDEFIELKNDPRFTYVQVFENRGSMMGCSNAHPHAQIWATEHVPNEAQKEWRQQADYFSQHKRSLLLDYLEQELSDGERVIYANEHCVALVPFWAVWPYETLLIPRSPACDPESLSAPVREGHAMALHHVLNAYDELFDSPMPYSMGFHSCPSDGQPHPEWQFHTHLYPPLLRSASIRKHMVGFEMLGMPQRDITPEFAAGKLRALIAAHE